MENKELVKRYLKKTGLLFILFWVFFLFIQVQTYHNYRKNTNKKVNAILTKVVEQYPSISKNELMEILNCENCETSFVNEYGINLKKEAIILENDKEFYCSIIINLFVFVLFLWILQKAFFEYQNEQDRELESIIKLVEQINHKNYELTMDTVSEDELSILKHEIYKTTLLLKEEAENSKKGKLELKHSLSDISHQIKTPLTSILVMLDNLGDHPNMESEVRNEFLHDVKREIMNIQFLVGTILKLAKLDSNTVEFQKESVSVWKLLEEAKENVKLLCDLKNVCIEIYSNKESKIVCDFKWQVEAITNILKNSVEHSVANEKVVVHVINTPLYVRIQIENVGNPMDEQDLPHIFERFYKGKNAKADSIGIGLSLSKKIIESANGSVSVISNTKKTVFQIIYFINL